MAYSFSTSGATPTSNVNPLSTGSLNLNNSTPQAKALSGAQSSPSINWNALALSPSSSPAKAKSQTVQHPDGTKITTNYDNTAGVLPPAQNSADASQAKPITGNTTTPSGATVNATTGALVNNAPPATYPGLINSLAQTSQQGSEPGQQYTAQTATAGQGNEAIGKSAADIAARYGSKIAAVGQQGANAQAGYESTGTTPVAVGNAGIIAQNTAAQESALAAGESAALQGTGQQLTAQSQEATAENAAAGTANTAQANKQSGLSSAGTLSTPGNAFIQVPFNQQLVGADGQPIGGANGNGALQSAVVNAINLIKSGSGYSNALQAANLGQFGPQGTTALLNALGKNFNVNSSDAEAAAVANNINTTGTAATSAANTAYNSAVQKVAANTATYSALTGVSSNLNDTLANWTQKGTLTNVNSALNTVAGLTSNPDYQKFVTALGNAQASYQAALGSSGVTPTKADQDAVAALSPNSSATAINAALNQLSADAHALLIVPAYQQQQTYGHQLGIQ